MRASRPSFATAVVWLGLVAAVHAHLLVHNSLDVVIGRDEILLEARVSPYEIVVTENGGTSFPSHDRLLELAAAHRSYLLSHIRVLADGRAFVPEPGSKDDVRLTAGTAGGDLASYHFRYRLASPPRLVAIQQDCLKEYQPSDASFVVRARQSDQTVFEAAELHRDSRAEFTCAWTDQPGAAVAGARTHLDFGATVIAFLKQGIWHILTGFDHLLFVGGLVLAARSLVDLVKLVGAFTLAHTVTLTLSVLSVVTLDSRVVEPMISASIVIVALRNIFWPRPRTNWMPLAIAFGFGLFHGLGFAGGLRDAMAELPRAAFWTALIAFSIGVELGHQTVVLPLYAFLSTWRDRPEYRDFDVIKSIPLVKWCSSMIAVGGIYFLIETLGRAT